MKISSYKLKNGVSVILEERHESPVVALQLWVHVGSKDEDDTTRGLAHIQEHMLFQGTKTFSKNGEIPKIVESVGGHFNAFTSYDCTVYHITLPSKNVETGLAILGSMMHEATITKEDLKKELQVIMEEFKRSKDNPESVLWHGITNTMYQKHPYKHPVIGYQKTIEETTALQVKNFYKKWYVPDNMNLVIVGDFENTTLKKVIEKTFGKIKKQKNPKRAIAPEPTQKTSHALVLQEPFGNYYLDLGFRLTHCNHEDAAALEILFHILGGDESSRLSQKIQEEKELVSCIQSGAYLPENDGLGYVQIETSKDKILQALEATLQEIYTLRYTEIPEAELTKVKNQVEASYLYEQELYEKRAGSLGFFQTLKGDYKKEKEYREKVKSLTSQDIQKMAEKYLQHTSLTLGILCPEKERKAIDKKKLLQLAQKVWEQQEKKKIISEIQSKKYDKKANVTNIQFKNGIKLFVREDHTVATVSVQIGLLGGSMQEKQKNNGLANLFAEMLMYGTQTKTQKQIAEMTLSWGSHISAFASSQSFGITGQSTAMYQKETLALMIELLTESIFDEKECEKVKRRIMEDIKRSEDSPRNLLFDAFKKALYGKHPYSQNQDGTIKSLRKIKQKDLILFGKQNIVPQNMTIAIVGDVQTDEIIEQISTVLGNRPKDKNYKNPVASKPKFPTKIKKIYTKSKKQQSNIFLGFPAISLESEERFAFEVLNKILSGLGGRLFQRLRDQESLAYSTSGMLRQLHQIPGFYGVYIGTSPEKQDQAIEGILRELQILQTEKISEKEVEDAKQFLMGNFDVSSQSFCSQGTQLLMGEIYGLGYDDYLKYKKEISKIKAEDIQKIAKKYFSLDRYVLSVVGPKKI